MIFPPSLKLPRLWLGGVLCLLVACGTTSENTIPVQDGTLKPADVGTILIPDSGLASELEVEEMRADATSLLQAFVRVRNKGNSPVSLKTRFLFKDAAGFTKEITPWENRTLISGKSMEFTTTASAAEVSRFILQFEKR
jgi:uncharacterized protein YcfL